MSPSRMQKHHPAHCPKRENFLMSHIVTIRTEVRDAEAFCFGANVWGWGVRFIGR